jgi:Recombinase zinc beta ribbon domain
MKKARARNRPSRKKRQARGTPKTVAEYLARIPEPARSAVNQIRLLTSFAECGVWRGTLHVRSRSHGKRRAFFYACSNYHLRGRSVCTNRLDVPMKTTDDAVTGQSALTNCSHATSFACVRA